jgi:hypothetical protein
MSWYFTCSLNTDALQFHSGEVGLYNLRGDPKQSVGERKSKRSRKGRSVLNVSSSTQLSMLKIHVSESLGFHPRNCALYACRSGAWLLLEGNDITLKGAILPIISKCKLWGQFPFVGELESACFLQYSK